MEPVSSAANPGPILQLKIRLLGISPMVWRRIDDISYMTGHVTPLMLPVNSARGRLSTWRAFGRYGYLIHDGYGDRTRTGISGGVQYSCYLSCP